MKIHKQEEEEKKGIQNEQVVTQIKDDVIAQFKKADETQTKQFGELGKFITDKLTKIGQKSQERLTSVKDEVQVLVKAS